MNSPPDTTGPRWELLGLAAIVMLCLMMRLYHLDKSYWLDEFFTLRDAKPSYGEILRERHNPLIFVMAKFTVENMGDAEALLRLPSVVGSLIALIFAFAIARRAGGEFGGLFAALILGTSPYFLRFSQEARYYALLVCAGLALVTVAWWCVRSPRSPLAWLSLVAILFLGTLVHAFFVPFAGGTGGAAMVAAMLSGGTGAQRSWRRSLGVAAALALVCGATIGAIAITYQEESFVYRFGEKILLKVGDAIGLVETENAAELSENAAVPEGFSGQTYRLTPAMASDFLSQFFPFSWWTRLPLLLLGVAGCLALALRDRALAIILIGAAILSPIPVSFLSSKHPIYARYLIIELSFLYVLIGAGGGAVCQWGFALVRRQLAADRTIAPPAAHRLDRLTPLLRRVVPAFVVALLAAILVGSWVGANVVDIRNYYNWTPRRGFPYVPFRDWKGAAEVIADGVREGDVILYSTVHSSGASGRVSDSLIRQQVMEPLGHYLRKRIPAYLEASLVQEGVFSAGGLATVLRHHPDRRVAVVARYGSRIDGALRDLAAELSDQVFQRGDLWVWIIDRPHDNLIANWNFDEHAASIEEHPAMSLEREATFAREGGVLRLTSGSEANVYWNARLNMTRRLDLQNSSFEEWRAGTPVAWEVVGTIDGTPAGSSAVEISPTWGAGRHAVAFPFDSGGARLVQTIDAGGLAGKAIRLSALGMSSLPNDLGLGVRWNCCGEIRERVAYHSGSGAWERMEAVIDLSEIDATHLSVEIVRNASSRYAFVDDVAAEMEVVRPLDPGKHYSLSFLAKYRGVESDNPWGAFRVAANAFDRDGKQEWRSLAEFRGTNDQWSRIVVPITPGAGIPEQLSEIQFHVGLFKARGEVWLTSLSLEEGSRTQGFTARPRPPHDVLLSKSGLFEEE
jgi:hypothetical protein